MNHQNQYNKIISRAKAENRVKLRKTNIEYVYYENHHIYPKCLGGGNEKENMQLLTAKEHYVCHKLLTYVYKENRKIACAFHKMTFSKKYGKIVSGRDYAYAKELISTIPISEITRKKLSDAWKGENNPQWGKPGFSTGKKHSEESKKKRSENMIGEKNPQWGLRGELSINWKRKYSEETLKKMGISQRKRLSNKENHPMYKKHHSFLTKEKLKKLPKMLQKKNVHIVIK